MEVSRGWKFVKLEFANYVQSLVADFASMTVTYVDQPKFVLLLDALRTNSLPVTDIIYTGYGRVTDDNWTRLHAIMEALEQNNIVKSLTVRCGFVADEGSKPFFKKLASPQCKLQKLCIGTNITVKRAILLKKALKKNKSIQELQLSSNTHPVLGLLKANTTIKLLSVGRTTFDSKTIKSLKANRTLEIVRFERADPAAISSNVNKRDALFHALAAIGSLTTVAVDLSGGRNWSMKPLAEVVKGNPRLAHLKIFAEKEIIDAFADMDALGQALAQQQSLKSLDLSHSIVPILKPLKNTSSLEEITLSLYAHMKYPWFGGVLTSITSLKQVNFWNSRYHEDTYIDLATLLRAESRINVWKFTCRILVHPESFEELKTRPIHPCCIELNSNAQKHFEEFTELMVQNPFVEVKFRRLETLLVDTVPDETRTKLLKTLETRREKLMYFKTLFQFLAIISLTKQDHFFSLLPNEVLLLVCTYISDRKISSKILLRARAMASDREFMLGSEQANPIPRLVRFWMEENSVNQLDD
jgi:hypothetical protein